RYMSRFFYFFFFQAEDCIRDLFVTGVQTCALPIYAAGNLTSAVVVNRIIFEVIDDDGAGEIAGGVIGRHRQRLGEHLAQPVIAKIGRASCRERVVTTVAEMTGK